ncbi:MarR family transcriptional regulator [Sphingobium sp.]|uniref:MarR family winged helix-turn-helix transcriptional regulator n=1 Tax=Sphingobium sp. TaxID=1912891 RepID=UPI002C41817E|nr:MarR family transcriptional regulator [Sphingobium sp.]HUD94488.1 MarR family transcriptional regulator [Sphingobium sp.]
MKTGEKVAVAVAKSDMQGTAKPFTFGYLVHDVSRVRRVVMDMAMRPYDITRSQWSVLTTLARGGNDGMMQVDLARLMEVGKVTVGGLIDRLEASGHVERRPDATDRRVKRVFITPKGHGVVKLMVEVASDMNQRILAGLSAEEIAMCEHVLGRVKKNLKTILVENGGANGLADMAAEELDD